MSDEILKAAASIIITASGTSSTGEDVANLLCGRFVALNKRGRFDEPTFENKRTRLFVYQRVRDEWVIGSRRGGTSYRASSSSPLLGDATWSAFDGEVWIDLQLACRVSEANDDLQLGAPAPMLVVSCRFDNIAGLYRRRNSEEETESGGVRLQCAVGQYWNEEDAKVLWHNPRSKGGCWMISDPSGVLSAASDTKFSSFVASEAAAADTSPDEADWSSGANHISLQVVGSYQLEKGSRAIEHEVGKFCDADFPADASSIGTGLVVKGVSDPGEIVWVRAQAMLPPAEVPTLFNCVEPDDILQGALGDCWLLASIATIAEFPQYVQEHIFVTKSLDGESDPGKYRVRLYDAALAEGEDGWTEVVVDDRIPCNPKRHEWFDTPTPAFAGNNGAELWVMLLEKAFAKFAGSYAMLQGGAASRAWIALTGCTDVQYYEINGDGPDAEWSVFRLSIKPEHVGRDKWGKSIIKPAQGAEVMSGLAMFDQLRESDDKNYLMAASIGGGANGIENKRADGLIEGHAYSLIRVREIPLEGGTSARLLMLRNPYGNQEEWNGPWGDKSELWKKHNQVARAVGFSPKADGLFWMAWDDFSACFNQIEICRKEMPSLRAQFQEEVDSGKANLAGGEGVGKARGRTEGGKSVAPAAKKKPLPGVPLLQRPGLRLAYPTITIDPVPAQPDAPFAQYVASCLSYRKACEKAEREQGLM